MRKPHGKEEHRLTLRETADGKDESAHFFLEGASPYP